MIPPRLARPLAGHAKALAAYLSEISALPQPAWLASRSEGTWSPAEITEHLALAYDVLAGELRGGPPMALRGAGWRVRLQRWLVLPHILFHGRIPLRVPAPREVRPVSPPATPLEGTARLRGAAQAFVEALDASDARGQLTHAYFGGVSPVRAVRFIAIHLEHHRAQVAEARQPASS